MHDVSLQRSSGGASDSPDVLEQFSHPEIRSPARLEFDPEGIVQVDNDALRIAPPIEPGWGRTAIAYGPFERQAGVAFAVFMLNGHNTAQSENLPEPFWQRIDRWWRGSGAYSRPKRLAQWWSSGRRARTLRTFRWWWRLRKGRAVPRIDENLAVGWFDTPQPTCPVGSGSAFVMHATGADNGELWVNAGQRGMPVVTGVRNLPLYFVVVLRERGAAYYVASVPGTRHFPGHGSLRPIAIDAVSAGRHLFAVIAQSTLGQIGFRIDSRIYGTRVVRLDDWSRWYGTAHAADALCTAGSLDGRTADIGGRWEVLRGSLECLGPEGAVARSPNSMAVLRASEATGLLHALVRLRDPASAIGLVWRCRDSQNYLQFKVSAHRCALMECLEGRMSELASSEAMTDPSATVAVQIVDDGAEIRGFVDGRMLVRATVVDRQATPDAGVGLSFGGAGSSSGAVTRFEAHPRCVALPSALDLGVVSLSRGTRIAAHEQFEGEPRPLEGKPVTKGVGSWERWLGRGSLDITGDGNARVRASVEQPNPGRTGFLLPWSSPAFADLELTATLPGNDRGQREKARIGFVVWQDDDNYFIVNTWNSDGYDGGSMSSFFHIDGFEDLYDAVWVNVGRALWWGRTIRLRLRFDGGQYLVELDDEPVLYRKLSDVYPHCAGLKINKVGVIINWEWGDDTGTVVHEFIARSNDG